MSTYGHLVFLDNCLSALFGNILFEAALAARVEASVDVDEARRVHVRVDLRCGDVRMAKHLLYCADVGAVRKQVRGEAVAQGVWVDFVGEAGLHGRGVDDAP